MDSRKKIVSVSGGNEIKDPDAEVKCVLCERSLGYPNKTPFDARPYPVDCAGDLCDECDRKIYGRRH